MQSCGALLNDYPKTIQPVNSGSLQPACLPAPQAVLWLVQVRVLLIHLSKIIHHNEEKRPLLDNVKISDLDLPPNPPLFFILLLCFTGTERRVTALWNHVRRAIIHHKSPTEEKNKNPPASEDNRAFCLPHCQWHSVELLLIMACFSSEPSAFISHTLFSLASKLSFSDT